MKAPRSQAMHQALSPLLVRYHIVVAAATRVVQLHLHHCVRVGALRPPVRAVSILTFVIRTGVT
jgi:hypothetical protein